MNTNYFLKLLFLLITFNATASSIDSLAVSNIDNLLLQNANAVVRLERIDVSLNDLKSITYKKKLVLTILNKYGEKFKNLSEYYDPETKIKSISATVYDVNGNEVKKYKKKDFKDYSYSDGFSIIGDGRFLYAEHTPVSYPYTIEFNNEVETANTAFIQPWFPIKSYFLSVEKSVYNFLNYNESRYRTSSLMLEEYAVNEVKKPKGIVFNVSNVPSVKPEVLSPSFDKLVPYVRIALEEFNLVNKSGNAIDWKTIGKWQYDNLIANRSSLPEETVAEITKLTSTASGINEKAKIIYQYVQDNTRYVSIQLGIGGWMPMDAAEVDRLGYGDCKALTNYTKALLETQDISSNYCVVYAGDKRNIDDKLPSFQGNHVILNLPMDNEDDVWLECTNQKVPYNYLGNFTDDRKALLVKPNGGEILRTKKYLPEENTESTNAEIHLKEDRSLTASIERFSKGLEYEKHQKLLFLDLQKQKEFYLDDWGYLRNIKINNIHYQDNKDSIEFKEFINIECSSYLKKVGDKLVLAPNFFNRVTTRLPEYEERKANLVIERGYCIKDVYTIHCPEGYEFGEALESVDFKNKFGEFSYQISELNKKSIKLERYFKVNDGNYSKSSYREYRDFIEKIRKIDQRKMLIFPAKT